MADVKGKNNYTIDGNNSHIGDVNQNLFNSLKTTPKDITLHATVNNQLFTILVTVFTVCLFLVSYFLIGYFSLTYIFSDSNTDIALSITLMLSGGISMLTMIYLLEFADKLAHKLSSFNIIYKDGTLKVNGNTYQFYDDIWDIVYNPNKYGLSGKLTLFIVNQKTQKPFSMTITFTHKAGAKYVYDSFCSQQRIKEYLGEARCA